MTGTVSQGPAGEGLYAVDISLTVRGHSLNALAVHLRCQQLSDGGLQMTSSRVTLGNSSDPSQYQGSVTALDGTNLTARVSDAAGRVLTLALRLRIDPESGSVTGLLHVGV